MSAFRTLSFHEQRPVLPLGALRSVVTAPAGCWPGANGSAGNSGRSAERLPPGDLHVSWRAALPPGIRPRIVLVDGEHVVVDGLEQLGIWKRDGSEPVLLPTLGSTPSLDLAQRHLLRAGASGLQTLTLEGSDPSSYLSQTLSGRITTVLQGPGLFVLAAMDRTPHGAYTRASVESVRIRDYADTSNGVLYGVDSLGGITSDSVETLLAAAACAGPVLATDQGVEWRDWQLQLRGEAALPCPPTMLSVDDADCAHLLLSDVGRMRLLVVPPGGAPRHDLLLPEDGTPLQPPLLAADGRIYIVSDRSLIAISPQGEVLWRQPIPRDARASLTEDGTLLLGGPELVAVDPEGQHTVLARTTEPILTPPVLAQGRIHVATASTLFMLTA